MRVVIARSAAVSYVSPIRVLRVPRPGEIGFGLSDTLRAGGPTLSSRLGGGGASEVSMVLLKIFVPVAAVLVLFALLLTAVCCLRGGRKARRTWRRSLDAPTDCGGDIALMRKRFNSGPVHGNPLGNSEYQDPSSRI